MKAAGPPYAHEIEQYTKPVGPGAQTNEILVVGAPRIELRRRGDGRDGHRSVSYTLYTLYASTPLT